jgi:DNA-binding NarL/FixJ family response regulator
MKLSEFYQRTLFETVYSALIVENFRPIAEIWELALKSMGANSVTIIENSDDVAPFLATNKPDIILMDINLPGSKNGIQLTNDIKNSAVPTKVIVVSLHDEPHYLRSSLAAGAQGYVVKNSPLSELKTAITTVLDGQTYICEKMRQYTIN